MKVTDYPCPRCLAEPGVLCTGGRTHRARHAVWRLCTLRHVGLTDRKTWWNQVEDAIKAREGVHE